MSTTAKLYTFQEMMGGSIPIEAIFYAIAAHKKKNYTSYLEEKNKALEKFKTTLKEFFLEQGVIVGGIEFDYTTGFQMILKGASFNFPDSMILEDSFGEKYTAQLGEMYQQKHIGFVLFACENSPIFMTMSEGFDSYFKSVEERNAFIEVFDKNYEKVNVKLHRMMEYAVKMYVDFSIYFNSEDYQGELYREDSNCFNHLRFTRFLDVVE